MMIPSPSFFEFSFWRDKRNQIVFDCHISGTIIWHRLACGPIRKSVVKLGEAELCLIWLRRPIQNYLNSNPNTNLHPKANLTLKPIPTLTSTTLNRCQTPTTIPTSFFFTYFVEKVHNFITEPVLIQSCGNARWYKQSKWHTPPVLIKP